MCFAIYSSIHYKKQVKLIWKVIFWTAIILGYVEKNFSIFDSMYSYFYSFTVGVSIFFNIMTSSCLHVHDNFFLLWGISLYSKNIVWNTLVLAFPMWNTAISNPLDKFIATKWSATLNTVDNSARFSKVF